METPRYPLYPRIPIAVMYQLRAQIRTPVIPASILAFKEKYQQMEAADREQPLFTKAPKFNNQLIRVTNFSSQRRRNYFQRNEMFQPKTERSRIEKAVRFVMNKITEHNFDVIHQELVTTIRQYDNAETLAIVVQLILDKAVQDAKFQTNYLNMVQLINQETEWIQSLVNVIHDDQNNGYYWMMKTQVTEDQVLNGPFPTHEAATASVLDRMSIRKYWVRELNRYYTNRADYIRARREEIDDEVIFRNRRKINGTVELICKTYLIGWLSSKVLHICLLDWIHRTDVSPLIEEDIESVSILYKQFQAARVQPMPIQLWEQYLEHCRRARGNLGTLSRRYEFILDEIVGGVADYRRWSTTLRPTTGPGPIDAAAPAAPAAPAATRPRQDGPRSYTRPVRDNDSRKFGWGDGPMRSAAVSGRDPIQQGGARPGPGPSPGREAFAQTAAAAAPVQRVNPWTEEKKDPERFISASLTDGLYERLGQAIRDVGDEEWLSILMIQYLEKSHRIELQQLAPTFALLRQNTRLFTQFREMLTEQMSPESEIEIDFPHAKRTLSQMLAML